MLSKESELENGQVVATREACEEDAAALLEYVNRTTGETDYLSFGPGELNLSQKQEKQFIETHLNSDNKLFVIAKINQEVVGSFALAGAENV